MKMRGIVSVRAGLFIAGTVVALASVYTPSMSCSCIPASTNRRHIEKADVIFAGFVTGIESTGPQADRWQAFYDYYVFSVTHVWRGSVTPTSRVFTVDSCTPRFKTGIHYLVYARERDSRLWVERCGGHPRVSTAYLDRYILGEPLIDWAPGSLSPVTADTMMRIARTSEVQLEQRAAAFGLVFIPEVRSDAISLFEAVIRGDLAGDRVLSAEVLGFMGQRAEPAVPTLLWACENGPDTLRAQSIRSLCEIRPGDTSFIAPLVLAGLSDDADCVRWQAMNVSGLTLGQGGLRGFEGDIVTSLILNLYHDSAKVRAMAAASLRSFGNRALIAIPRLYQLRDGDPDKEVRRRARSTIDALQAN